MSNKYTYNGETDFLEWYKNNYGTDYNSSVNFSRPEEMSDAVWNTAMQLYNSYTQGLKDTDKKNTAISNTNKYYDSQKNSLLANYSTNLNALDESKQRAQENASITLDKLKKYLPTQMKMQGLSGLGVSESSALQAYNNYMNEMGDISANYDKNKTTLDTEKTSAENNLEKYRIDALTKINTEYDGYERTRAKEGGEAALDAYLKGVETEQGNNFAGAKTYIESYSGTDAGELENYINTYSGKVSASQLENLKALGRSQVATNVKIKEEEEQGNNFAAAKVYIESYSGTDAGELENYIINTYSGKVSNSQLENLKASGRSQVAKNVENANKIAAEEKDLVLEYTIIPRLDEFEANGEWDKALSYLEENKDNFTNQREYEAKHNFITDKIEEKKKEDEIKKNEEAVILGNTNFYAPGDENHMYFIDTSRNHDNKYITQTKEFKEALNAKGLTNDSNIPNGTTLEYTVKTSAMGSGSLSMPMCVSYFNGKWYHSYKREISEHLKNRRYGTASSVTASPGATSSSGVYATTSNPNLSNYLK